MQEAGPNTGRKIIKTRSVWFLRAWFSLSLVLLLFYFHGFAALADSPQGYWRLVNVENIGKSESFGAKGSSRRGRIDSKLVGYNQFDRDKVDTRIAGYISWKEPPEKAKPGEIWDGKFHAELTDSYQAQGRPVNYTFEANVSYKGVSQASGYRGRGLVNQDVGVVVSSAKGFYKEKTSTFVFPQNGSGAFDDRFMQFIVVQVRLEAVQVVDTYNYYYRWIGQRDAPSRHPTKSLDQEDVDVIDEWIASLLGLGQVGGILGPATLGQALIGMLLPGLLSILLGALAGGGSGVGDHAGTVLSDGRTYYEGQEYALNDGNRYVMRNGELHILRQLQEGEVYTDSDGSRRIWIGGQAWMESDWRIQAQTSQQYAQAQQEDWDSESRVLNKNLVEEMERHQEDTQLLSNLHQMRWNIIFGGDGMSVLRRGDQPGDVHGRINSLTEGFLSSGKMDRESYQQLRRVYGRARQGDILSESELHTRADIFRNTFTEGIQRTSREIVTGADSEGNRSYKSMALRALVAVATGGSSEMAYTPASALYTMKDYVEAGGDSVLEGFRRTVGDVVKGEIFGGVFGAGLKTIGRVSSSVTAGAARVVRKTFPNATRTVVGGIRRVRHELTKQRRSPFAPKVQPRPKIPPKVSPRPSASEVRQKVAEIRAQATKRTPGLKINKESFVDAGQPADLRGMPVRDRRAVQVVADRYGVKAHMRPTNPESRSWLATKKAHSKPEMLKTKTINDLDVELGFSRDRVGTVACKRPVLPPKRPPGMSESRWQDLQKRYAQRSREFADQHSKLQALADKGEIKWDPDTGSITNAKTGKPYAGDHDAFAFVDAKTGEALPADVNARINRELQSMGATCHAEHVGWDFSGEPKTVPLGASPGAQSPYDIAAGIDQKILNGHAGGGQPLNTYDPLGPWMENGELVGGKKGWGSSWWQGGVRDL